MHCKAGSVVAIAVLLNIITEGQLGDGLIARIVQTSHHVDTACTTINRGGQTAHRAVTRHATGSKIPGTILGIAGQAGTASVHYLGRSRGIATHRAGRTHLALNTPALRHVQRRCLGIAVPHAVKILGHLRCAGCHRQRILCPNFTAPCTHHEHGNGKTE